ncbi:MAG: glutamyl-tRNA reductase [Candidatus Verstraetearchaeota archaeon]|nr:glutamyl-tRNA reductase [Candidatus Verstraetearchaeota archaeon]
MMTRILCLSISHKKAPVRVLESFTLKDVYSSLQQLKSSGAEECAIIQTCHRVELYAVGSGIGHNDLKAFLISNSGSCCPIELYEDFYEGEDAIRHLFYLASGLESIILGENEVLHQVEESLRLAENAGCIGRTLRTIFRGAINAGRMVRRKTSISKGSVSLGNIVMKVITCELGTLNGKKLVIIGAGKMGSLIAKSIPRKDPLTIFIANRTYSRAEKLAAEVGGKALHFESMKEAIKDADAVICATSSPHLILETDDLQGLEVGRKTLIVDVSNPRGVDERIKSLNNVKFVDLDQITRIARENIKKREDAALKAREILEPSIERLMERLCTLDRKKKLEDMMRWAEDKRKSALLVALKKGKFSEDQVKVLDEFSYAFMRDILIPLFGGVYGRD